MNPDATIQELLVAIDAKAQAIQAQLEKLKTINTKLAAVLKRGKA